MHPEFVSFVRYIILLGFSLALFDSLSRAWRALRAGTFGIADAVLVAFFAALWILVLLNVLQHVRTPLVPASAPA